MILTKLNRKATITGESGRKYRFEEVYEINQKIEHINELCPEFKYIGIVGAVYIFTKRHKHKYTNKYSHKRIYCGKSEDLSTRFYTHNDDIITEYKANCICVMPVNNDDDLLEIEEDILEKHDFECNIQHNLSKRR
jgi:hypothetical protein